MLVLVIPDIAYKSLIYATPKRLKEMWIFFCNARGCKNSFKTQMKLLRYKLGSSFKCVTTISTQNPLQEVT